MKRNEPQGEVLTEAMSERLLLRASELDAATRSGAKLTELRDAAAEAGISTQAFDAALAEMQGAVPASTSVGPVRRRRRWTSALVAGIVAVLAFSTYAVGRLLAPTVAVATAEEVFVLRCLTNAEAAEMVRPLLKGATHSIVSTKNAPRVITVRASSTLMPTVRALLEKHDGAGAAACSTARTTP
jgi:hypothetical protein